MKLQSKNLSVLKNEYGVSVKTLKKWLHKIPDLKVDGRDTRDYTPKEVGMIYRHLGIPDGEFEE